MVELKVCDRDGKFQTVSGETNTTLMEALRDAGLEISSICGGTCSCGTCHVWLSGTWFDRLSQRSDDELDLLETLPTFEPDASRLSCQIRLTAELDGLELTVAPNL